MPWKYGQTCSWRRVAQDITAVATHDLQRSGGSASWYSHHRNVWKSPYKRTIRFDDKTIHVKDAKSLCQQRWGRLEAACPEDDKLATLVLISQGQKSPEGIIRRMHWAKSQGQLRREIWQVHREGKPHSKLKRQTDPFGLRAYPCQVCAGDCRSRKAIDKAMSGPAAITIRLQDQPVNPWWWNRPTPEIDHVWEGGLLHGWIIA